MGLKEQILGAKDTHLIEHKVDEWGVSVWLKTWSGLERATVQNMHKSERTDMIARVVAMSACDADGVRLFSDKDVAQLNEKNGAILERVALKALDHNGVNKVEDEKKESETTQN